MHLRHRFARSLAVIGCLAFVVAPAFAERPGPTDIKQLEKPLPLPASPAASCPLGVLGPPANAFGYVFPPGDAYYTLMDPASCGCPNGVKATVAHMSLVWTSPCLISGTYSIVPATLSSPGCYAPDPFAPPICPPAPFSVSDGGVLNQCVDVQLPFADPCCFSAPVFLKIEFDSGTCPPGRPGFCGPASCTNCRQYNIYPGSPPFGDDLCVVLTPPYRGVIMWADTECCIATPALPHTWGKVKTLYR